MWTRTGRSRLLSILSALLLLAGCGRSINRAAERRIRDLLPAMLGEARDYQVRVSSAPERTLRGRLANVRIEGADVQLANGLLLDRLTLNLRGVEVDTRQKRVHRIGQAQFQATLREASLDEYFAGEAPQGESIRKIRIALEPDASVILTAERIVAGVGVPFRIQGTFRIAPPCRIELDPERLTVVGVPIGGIVLRFVKSRLEAAFDLRALPFPVSLTGVRAIRGALHLTGTVDTAALLERIQAGPR